MKATVPRVATAEINALNQLNLNQKKQGIIMRVIKTPDRPEHATCQTKKGKVQ